MHRYEIRAATPRELDPLADLAAHLDTVNLPADRGILRDLLAHSEASFAGDVTDVRKREYVFVLWDAQQERAVGTSTVIGQLGRRDAPYIYFDVQREEKYSATLDRHFVHTVLETCYSYDGPTELGGLVVHPDCRRRPERLGTVISYVRMLFLAVRRQDFRDHVVAELLPPLLPDGRSHLWEAVGRRFTGLTYREADRLSKRNKEFIRGLFPDEIYATLLSPEAQALIGHVGPDSRGVETLLRRVGFRYAERVDPFDGGPHFVADTDAITLVQSAHQRPLALGPLAGPVPHLLAVDSHRPPYFRAALLAAQAGAEPHLEPAAAAGWQLAQGDPVWWLPLLSPAPQDR